MGKIETRSTVHYPRDKADRPTAFAVFFVGCQIVMCEAAWYEEQKEWVPRIEWQEGAGETPDDARAYSALLLCAAGVGNGLMMLKPDEKLDPVFFRELVEEVASMVEGCPIYAQEA